MIYLDNAATTAPSESVLATMEAMSRNTFGNPSSLHMAGVEAEKTVEAARDKLAGAIGAARDEVCFGPSGTLCNNVAILGAARALRRRGNRVVISTIEHACVRETAKSLADEGFEVIEAEPTEEGFRQTINDKTVLVSCMLVNNETGLILPVHALKNIILSAGAPALLHTDCVQALGKIPVQVKKLGVDLATFSAHKLHGPKGVGALYVKKGTRLVPVIFGGGQEKGLFSGTHNTPGIAGFGEAVRLAREEFDKRQADLKQLSEAFVNEAQKRDYLAINRDGGSYAPHIVNISFMGYMGENVLHYLESEGVYVSVGAACSNNSGHGSILDKMHKDIRHTAGAIRVSFSHANTLDDIQAFFAAADKAAAVLIKKYK
ncbi:MAG: cysteine desulfurase [Clostridia bacterium]|nr:cysteine desulfurase [Clostridia bacterium]